MDVDLARLSEQMTLTLASLDARQTQAFPPETPEKWNVQQIAEHLLLVMRVNAEALEARMRRGRPTHAGTTLKQSLVQWLVLGPGPYPSGAKTQTDMMPSRMAALESGRQLADRLHGVLVQWEEAATVTEQKLGRGPVLSHPLLGPLSVKQWKRFHVAHGRHHLRQIWRIRRARGF